MCLIKKNKIKERRNDPELDVQRKCCVLSVLGTCKMFIEHNNRGQHLTEESHGRLAFQAQSSRSDPRRVSVCALG